MKPVFHWLLITLRLIFGAWFVFAGLNDLLHFWQPPAPVTPQSQVFMQGLAGSGYIFPALDVVYTVSGLFLLTHRCVALALAMLAAPVVVIFGYHAVMEDHLLGQASPCCRSISSWHGSNARRRRCCCSLRHP